MVVFLGGNAQLCFATDYNWKGGHIDNVVRSTKEWKKDFDSSDDSKVFFLYNVGAGKFVYQGASWGTQPIISDKAIALNLCYDNFGLAVSSYRAYAFTSNLYTDEGYWLGHKEDAESVNGTKYDLYFDCSGSGATQSGYSNYGHAMWNFQDLNGNSAYWDASNGIYTYVIRAEYPATEIKSDHSNETYYLYYDEATGRVTTKDFGSYCTDVKSGPYVDKKALWKLVTLKEIKEKLQTLGTEKIDEPFDCTFFLADPDFNRCARNNRNTNKITGWQIGGVSNYDDVDCKTSGTDDIIGLKEGIDHCYTSKLDNTANFENRYGSQSLGTDQRKTLAKANGKYFCAQMKEFPGPAKTTRASIYQRWKCEMTGWYRVTCQGFKQSYDSGTKNQSYLYAKSFTSSNTCKNFRHVELLDINDYEALPGEEVSAPTTLLEAGKMFYDGRYTNTVYVYIEKGCQLELGIRFAGQNKWAAFDDFRLAYCGNTNVGLVLNENHTELSHITNASTDYKNFQGEILCLHRSFTPNKWNTIVLPVSITQRQSRELFGTATQIAKLTSYNNGHLRFDRVEHSQTKATDVVMEANTPYIIKPTEAPGSTVFEDTQFTDKEDDYSFNYNSKSGTNDISVVCPAPYSQTLLTTAQQASTDYMSATAFDNTNKMLEVPGYSTGGLTFHGTLTKTYDNDEGNNMFMDKYIVYDGTIYYVNYNYGLKGMRGYFSFDGNTDSANQAKTMTISIDGVEDDVTSIEGLPAATFFGARKNNGKVYNLGGQVVGVHGSTSGLAKGIYIVNGKKVVVK